MLQKQTLSRAIKYTAIALFLCITAAYAQTSTIWGAPQASIVVTNRIPVDQSALSGPGQISVGQLLHMITGDCTVNINSGAITCTKTNGTSFAAVATSGSASDLSTGTLLAARLPTPTTSALGGIEAINHVGSQWVSYIDTSGVPHLSQPADADISFTDTVTGNATISAHGFLKKLTGTATQYMDGSGNWSTPAAFGLVTTPYSVFGNNTASSALPTAQTSPIVSGSMTAASFISTTSTGNAPFTVTSTTNIPNLNASSLNGATFAAPGSIGSGTAGSGAFTSLTSNGQSVLTTSNTATMTNKTYDTAGTGNVLKVNGQQITAVSGNTGTIATSTGTLTNGHCVDIDSNGNFIDAGSACGGSASSGFNSLTSGTNTAAAMLVGSGASLGVTGSGTIAATSAPASGITGTLAASQGGTGQTSVANAFTSFFESVATTLGDIVYGGSSGAPTRLAGNTSATTAFLTGTGTGSAAAAPAWSLPSALSPAFVGTNFTGTAGSLTAGSVTTNANLTGPITSSGNATSVAGAAAGKVYAGVTPSFTSTPVLGVATSAAGTLGLSNGSASGTVITLQNPSNITTGYNYNFPATAGAVGALETSGGGGSAANIWLTDVATGQILTSGGTTAIPAFSATLPSAVQGNITGTGALTSGSITTGFTTIGSAFGGSGVASPTAHDVLVSEGASPFTPISPSTSGFVLTSNGASSDPSFQAASASGGTRALSTTDTVVGSDNGKLLTLSGVGATALTSAATIGASFTTYIKNTAATGVAINTITPNGSDNIDGSNSTIIILPGETRAFHCSGAAWTTNVIVPFSLTTTTTTNVTLPRNGYLGFSGQLWGGGASGGAGITDEGGGGGGGSYSQFTYLSNAKLSVASLQLTLTVGAGGVSQTTTNTGGNPGGNTSVEELTNFYFFNFAFGGGAGGGGSLGAGGGGAGTGYYTGGFIAAGTPNTSLSIGSAAVTTTAGGGGYTTASTGGSAGGGNFQDASGGGGGGGGNASTKLGGSSMFGGGGGGAAVATTGGAGGQSLWGGGGGGGGSNTTGGAGGISTRGGNGGAGGNAGAGINGSVPGGGGGGALGTTGSGAGAGGEVVLFGIIQ